ncbi:MAG: sulfurtransferase complex subunit TusC [Proteobacteria bacterium]|jgi:tRNA 2-thiouridine synthesizing protein C|nr:sulfurtransferase complex subunit TusC [Pseudomonadota bacterium]MBP10175.1 sulfurtransferase complex subunit TusC [Acidiferrobacteraceae bacterium]MDP6137667.1 sulfurtransferase complex subunit TusC [Arenicellales bacterium]HCF73134.1 sulfurtransferase complex subunit TusC [Gammaproteobacteria bacterium]MDP6391476.1 sulfurtransferase complex subunit TusC [Arenicellales bacterium]|tara:strand:- start:357 stop:764 length:408 start_codon:yes stop_codon:yes gene_type:complete
MLRVKKFMYVNRHAPHGTIYALEGLEVVLIGAAFDQDVSMAFIGDGVFQLKKGQDTTDSDIKNFSPTYRALGDYDVTQLYVERESLEERGLAIGDLMDLTWEDEEDDWAEKPSIRVVNRQELSDLLETQDVILNF